MNTITINLPDTWMPFLESQAVAEGHEGPSAYLESLLQRAKRRADFEAKVIVGIEELDQGLGIQVTPEFWQQMRADYCQRLGLPVDHAPATPHRTTSEN